MHKAAAGSTALGAMPQDEGTWEASVRVETQTVCAPGNAVKAEALSVFVGARRLLADAELKIAERSRAPDGGEGAGIARGGTCYGLVGPNGCGKSTLLRLVAERHLPVPQGWDVFFVSQHLPEASVREPIDEVLTADARRAELLETLASLEEELAAVGESNAELVSEVSDRLVEVENQLSFWSSAREDVAGILVALGFRHQGCALARGSEPALTTPMAELSGGWRMKVELAKALWLQPRLLLLDEPTNHLDFGALRWLEARLEEYPHTTVVVSHDVEFLHEVCQEILWVTGQKVESMPKQLTSQQDLARMQRRRALNIRFSVPDGDAAEEQGLSLHGVEFAYTNGVNDGSNESRFWRQKGDLRFSGSSRSVVLGKNGSGKSTLLSLCAGKLAPTRGTVDRTPGLRIAHYSQQTDDLDQHPRDSAAEYLVRVCREALVARGGAKLQAAAGRSGRKAAAAHDERLLEQARGVLSNFGFEGELAVGVPVGRLSGGQRACLKLAILSLQPAHILCLDEPTNHLDAEACEALAAALSEFNGGVVVVTHDETLIYRLVQCNWADSELLVCEEGSVRRLRDFGAHGLKLLKDEVRRSEEAECPDVSGCLRELQAPRRQRMRALERAPQEVRPEVPKRTAVGVSTGTSGVPPWLSHCRRRGERSKQRAAEVSLEAPASEAKGVADCAAVDAPERIEDREECILARSWSSTSPPSRDADAGGDRLLTGALEAVVSEIPARCQDTVSGAGGRHSRLRKDLVNLNKAVVKWLRQEQEGELSRDEIIDRIRGSVVAQRLRAMNGKDFDEEVLVQAALGRSVKVPGPAPLRRRATPTSAAARSRRG